MAKELKALAREITARAKPRFVDIPRLSRFAAAENFERDQKRKAEKTMCQLAKDVTALLEKEQRRLIKTWKK